MKNITLAYLVIILFFISNHIFGQSTANYNITLTNYWNASDHSIGTTFPSSNAHFSKLVGVNHNDNVTFLQMGNTATLGVENIAELGSNNEFKNNEVQPAIDTNNAEQYIDGADLFLADGNTIEINGL